MLWRDRGRFIPAIVAVAFSCVLITVQCGLVSGMLESGSFPIDNAAADIWITTPDTTGLEEGVPIPESWLLRLAAQPEVAQTEELFMGLGIWRKPGVGSSEVCCITGMRAERDSIGLLRQVSEDQRLRLTEPGSILVDDWDRHILSLQHQSGEFGDINGVPAHVVGTVRSTQGPTISYLYCSTETARELVPTIRRRPEMISYGLARCRRPEEVAPVVQRLRRLYPEMGVYSRGEFSRHVRFFWLIRTKAGAVMICTVVLSLLIGLVITGQTLYSAVRASRTELAMLDALGIPRWRLQRLVLAQALWVGVAGVILAQPVNFAATWAALPLHTKILVEPAAALSTALLTLVMAILAGLFALRSLDEVDPAILLH
jgi:putative ABC transport system permease protein